MLRFIPFSVPPVPIQNRFQDFQWSRQWLGIVVLSSLLISALSLARLSSKPHNLPQNSDAKLTLTAIGQRDTQSNDCQPHEVFRVSDRRCYQMQGE